MSTVQNTDLLLINRAGVDYKCTFADWKASQASINTPSITSPSNGAGQTITPQSDVITAAGAEVLPDGSVFQNITNILPDMGTAPSSISRLVAYSAGGFGSAFAFNGTFKNGATSGLVAIYGSNTLNGPWLRCASSGANNGATNDMPALTAGYTYVAFECYGVSPALNPGDLALTLTLPGGVTGTQVFGRTQLTFATAKDLSKFTAGSAVQQDSGGPASGTVGSVDTTAKTMTLATSTGTWSANTGNYVVGTPSLSADAALGETPTFTSSAFSAVGAVTHASSDWQVTLATDTTFAAPVVQSMADTTHKVRWDGGPLQANTDYIVRVRHNGAGISSAWSAVVTFKTKTTFP